MWFFIRHAESLNNASNNNDSTESGNKFNDERVPDPCLTKQGLKQAEKTACYLASEKIKIWQQTKEEQKIMIQTNPIFVAIYCSPMQRSLETASFIYKKLNCPVFVNPDLCEVGGVFHGRRYVKDNGTNELCTGKKRSEILNEFPDFEIDERITEEGWWQKPQETIKEALGRANKVSEWLWKISLKEINDYGIDSQKRVNILITHGLFQDMLMKRLLLRRDSLPSNEESSFLPCENCAISQISLIRNNNNNDDDKNNRICICIKWNSTDHLDNEDRSTTRIYPNIRNNT